MEINFLFLSYFLNFCFYEKNAEQLGESQVKNENIELDVEKLDITVIESMACPVRGWVN